MKLICKTVFGSHLYGTATPTSDNDIRGVFIPSKRDILLGRVPRTNKEQPEGLKDDFELYSLHHFIKLACEGQTVAFDMIWTPAAQVEFGESGWIWHNIYNNRHKFLSKRMNAFIGYARSQAAKYSLKGERLTKLQAFLGVLSTAHSDEQLGTLWSRLPRDDEQTSPHGVQELQIAGKWFGATTQVKFVRIAVENALKRYGQRANAAANAEGVDWKAMSHAVRVGLELHELCNTREIKFPLSSAKILLEIKKGQRSLEQIQDYLDEILNSIEENMSKNDLPEQVDSKFWEDWLCDIVAQELL